MPQEKEPHLQISLVMAQWKWQFPREIRYITQRTIKTRVNTERRWHLRIVPKRDSNSVGHFFLTSSLLLVET
ncbi:unnamed protein product [Allacma fusca]|uniref:Uncharacterized protein n=1 Tax=Allacma fusca TaxID=39272 RepID=A0A8J2P585_9HEXA|nr:unnamed protein product [Allacma fusca]